MDKTKKIVHAFDENGMPHKFETDINDDMKDWTEGGGRLASESEVKDWESIKSDAGALGTLKVLGNEAADTLAFGALKPIEKKLFTPEQWAQYEREEKMHPTASTVGTGIGLAAGAAIGSGEAGLFSSIEKLSSKGASKLVGYAGEKAASSVAGKVTQWGLKKAAEGAIYSAPKNVADFIADPEHDVFKMGQAIVADAAFGGAMLGAADLGGRYVVKPIVEKAKTILEPFINTKAHTANLKDLQDKLTSLGDNLPYEPPKPPEYIEAHSQPSEVSPQSTVVSSPQEVAEAPKGSSGHDLPSIKPPVVEPEKTQFETKLDKELLDDIEKQAQDAEFNKWHNLPKIKTSAGFEFEGSLGSAGGADINDIVLEYPESEQTRMKSGIPHPWPEARSQAELDLANALKAPRLPREAKPFTENAKGERTFLEEGETPDVNPYPPVDTGLHNNPDLRRYMYERQMGMVAPDYSRDQELWAYHDNMLDAHPRLRKNLEQVTSSEPGIEPKPAESGFIPQPELEQAINNLYQTDLTYNTLEQNLHKFAPKAIRNWIDRMLTPELTVKELPMPERLKSYMSKMDEGFEHWDADKEKELRDFMAGRIERKLMPESEKLARLEATQKVMGWLRHHAPGNSDAQALLPVVEEQAKNLLPEGTVEKLVGYDKPSRFETNPFKEERLRKAGQAGSSGIVDVAPSESPIDKAVKDYLEEHGKKAPSLWKSEEPQEWDEFGASKIEPGFGLGPQQTERSTFDPFAKKASNAPEITIPTPQVSYQPTVLGSMSPEEQDFFKEAMAKTQHPQMSVSEREAAVNRTYNVNKKAEYEASKKAYDADYDKRMKAFVEAKAIAQRNHDRYVSEMSAADQKSVAKVQSILANVFKWTAGAALGGGVGGGLTHTVTGELLGGFLGAKHLGNLFDIPANFIAEKLGPRPIARMLASEAVANLNKQIAKLVVAPVQAHQSTTSEDLDKQLQSLTGKKSTGNIEKDLDRAHTVLQHVAANGVEASDHLNDVVSPHFKMLAGHLLKKIPVNPNAKDPFKGSNSWEPTKEALDSFARAMAVGNDPTLPIKLMKAGLLKPDHMEVLANVFPDLLTSLQSGIMQQCARDPKFAASMKKVKPSFDLFMRTQPIKAPTRADLATGNVPQGPESSPMPEEQVAPASPGTGSPSVMPFDGTISPEDQGVEPEGQSGESGSIAPYEPEKLHMRVASRAKPTDAQRLA